MSLPDVLSITARVSSQMREIRFAALLWFVERLGDHFAKFNILRQCGD